MSGEARFALGFTVTKDDFPFMRKVHCGLEGSPLRIIFAKSGGGGNCIWGVTCICGTGAFKAPAYK